MTNIQAYEKYTIHCFRSPAPVHYGLRQRGKERGFRNQFDYVLDLQYTDELLANGKWDTSDHALA